MNESSVIIPADINNVINERVAFWQKYDEAQQLFQEINKNSSHVIDASTPAQIASELTDEKTPPVEIAIALKHLLTELTIIATATKDIATYRLEINAIEQNRKTMTIIGIVVAVVLLVIVYLALTGNL